MWERVFLKRGQKGGIICCKTHTHTNTSVCNPTNERQSIQGVRGVGEFMERYHSNYSHGIIITIITEIIGNSSSIWAELLAGLTATRTVLQSGLCNTDPWTMAEKRIARFICFSLLRVSNEAATEVAHRRVNETRGEHTNSVLTLSHYPISVRHPQFHLTPLVTAKPPFINEKIRFDEYLSAT